MTQVSEQSEYVTVAHVARYFGVSPQTIRRAIRAGRLESVRVGRVFRIPRAVLKQSRV